MSRIHDALKRAEQERATSMGTHVESTFDQPNYNRTDHARTCPRCNPPEPP